MATGNLIDVLSSILKVERRLTSSDDLNNINSGIYYQDGSVANYIPAHMPTEAYNAIFISFHETLSSRRKQFWISQNAQAIYFRCGYILNGSLTFSKWQKIDSTEIS